MLLSVQEMEVRKIRFDGVFEPGKIDFSSSDMRQAGPLHAVGEAEILENTGGEVRVRGHLDVTMECDCDRCLGPARFAIDAPFDLFYQPNSSVADEDEIAIDEGQAEIGFYQGAGLELEDILREQVLLLLPMHRLCSEACLGICPICGKNRNEADCRCTAQPADDRWSGLRNLKLESN